MGWSQLRTWLHSSRVQIGGSAVLDLLVRLPDDILAPLLSVTGGLVGSPVVGFGTTWLLFGVILYRLGPLAYGHLDVLPANQRGFRAIFALSAVTLGIGLQTAGRAAVLLAVLLPGTFAAGGILLAYLQCFHDWELKDPEGRAVTLLEFLTPGQDVAVEIKADFEYEGWLGRFGLLFFVLAVALILGLPVMVSALTVQVFLYAFPLFDFVVLGWTVSKRVLLRQPDRALWKRLVRSEFDFEMFLIKMNRNVSRSIQGAFMTLFILLGFLLSAGYLFLAVVAFPEVVELAVIGLDAVDAGVSIWAAVVLWNWCGVVVLLLTAGTYGLWAWTREFQRLPAFLDHWETREESEDRRHVVRPIGFVLFPVVCWILAFVIVTLDLASSSVSAALWPVTVGVSLGSVTLTHRRSHQSHSREYVWITAGLLVQITTLWLGANLEEVFTAVTTRESLLSVIFTPAAISLLVLVTAVVPHVERYERQYDDVRQYSFPAVLLVIGVLGTASLPFVPDRYRPIAIGFAALGLVAGPVIILVRYYDI